MYHFVLKNELLEVVQLSQWLNNTFAKQAQLSPKITFQLDLILEETITNIIEHAFDTPGTHDITVLFQVEANVITIQVIDSGKPFDPLSDHQVELPTTLEDAGKGGSWHPLDSQLRTGMQISTCRRQKPFHYYY